jgi:PAS domain-containing protein
MLKNKAMITNWFNGIPVAITVSDDEGKIVEMNETALNVFARSGGKELIGSFLSNCHNPDSMQIIEKLLGGASPHVYTIEKNGQKKLIFQTPWYLNGEVGGLVEISMVIPFEMPHYIRK